MAPSPPPDEPTADEPPSVLVGQVHRYPVGQPDGSTRCQLVLITSGPDEGGGVRGVVLGYEDQAAHFQPRQFA